MPNLIPLAFAIFVWWIPLTVSATGIVGSEISYQSLGNNQFKVILDVYLDCDDLTGFDDPAHVSVFNDAGTFITSLDMPVLNSDTVPNNIISDPTLLIPGGLCIKYAWYEGVVELAPLSGFYFVYQRCCRNETITNIVTPGTSGLTSFVYLSPSAKAFLNSAPSFGFYPPVFVVVGKPFTHSHAAVDIEADSLAYKFFTPFPGASSSEPQPAVASPPPFDAVMWSDPPYNLDQLPGPGSSPLTIHPETGIITDETGVGEVFKFCFTPMLEAGGVVQVKFKKRKAFGNEAIFAAIIGSFDDR